MCKSPENKTVSPISMLVDYCSGKLRISGISIKLDAKCDDSFSSFILALQYPRKGFLS